MEYQCSGKKYKGEKAIISLTSWKASINTVCKTIYSLIKQCPGFHIVLVLSEEEFPQKELPENLMLFVENGLVELLWVWKNNRPLTKVISDKYENVPIIPADQYTIYQNNFAANALEYNLKRRILCADVSNEENNSFGLFLHLLNNYNDTVEVRYLTNNEKILKEYPHFAVPWAERNCLIKWCDTICYTYENFADVSVTAKTKIFLQHGITWANSDKYIKHILSNSTFATCTIPRELDYFHNLNTTCKCVLTGMAIYDYDLSMSKSNKNIVIMFTYRSTCKMPWLQNFLNSPALKELYEKYGYTIYYVKHHNPAMSKVSVNPPAFIIEKHISELGDLIRTSDILITDYSSISFKASYLNKSVYYFQPDYDSYCYDSTKSKGWYDWKTECLGFRSDNQNEIFEKIFEEINGKFQNLPRKDFFAYNDTDNSERICKRILTL